MFAIKKCSTPKLLGFARRSLLFAHTQNTRIKKKIRLAEVITIVTWALSYYLYLYFECIFTFQLMLPAFPSPKHSCRFLLSYYSTTNAFSLSPSFLSSFPSTKQSRRHLFSHNSPIQQLPTILGYSHLPLHPPPVATHRRVSVCPRTYGPMVALFSFPVSSSIRTLSGGTVEKKWPFLSTLIIFFRLRVQTIPLDILYQLFTPTIIRQKSSNVKLLNGLRVKNNAKHYTRGRSLQLGTHTV